MVAAHIGLANLSILYDNNGSQTRCLQIPNPSERFRAFGCMVMEVDGHDVDELKNALRTPSEMVKVVVANTVKGFGCQTLVDNVFAWHRRSPNEEELDGLLEELNATAV